MKKLSAILLAVTVLFLLTGCSFSLYQREAESRDIYKEFIATDIDAADDYAARVSEKSGAAVVSVIANSVIRTNSGNYSSTQIFSGIIINAEGYVLTTSNAALLQVSSGRHVYSNKVMSAYAVLSAAYNDTTHYRLTLVDYDASLGLALFRFYDQFHYYTDASKNSSVDGFQFTARFSEEDVSAGDRCVSVGNSLGNALNADTSAPGSVDEIALTIMSGIVSDDEAGAEELAPVTFGGKDYGYILTTAPLNIDMYGGALFDENGYLIGLLALKIGYQSTSTGECGYFKRVGAACRVELLTAYIDSVADEIRSPIPYTVASASNGEVA